MPGLYVHIPFCVRKCAYCDFYSVETARGPLAHRLRQRDQPDQPAFLEAIRRELALIPADFTPDTVFFGGGTPTELSEADLVSLLKILADDVDLSGVVEWTCESNPGTLTMSKIEKLLAAGVNRFSLGVQSFDSASLEFLGRIHTAEEAREGVRMLRQAGVQNLNIDLMYGVPGMSMNTIRRDLESVLALEPEHIAWYGLIFEEGTPLNDLRRRGFVKEVDEDAELQQYEFIRSALQAAGYRHYEISNFAKPGHECRHNLLYWSGGEYIGIGPSAHSHWRGVRWGNVRDLGAYIRRLECGESPVAFREELPPDAKARETLVMSLRRLDGVSRHEFRSLTGYDYAELCADALPWLIREGLLDDSGDRLRLTEKGLFVSDSIFAELV
ncbi:MAG: radical SAM family heme chaperone HemW [Kiritimatiellae bacterium]|nr:radical SAM family heme chaperone HemW [Kiritimatiellia bacterium]MDW8459077.1 radical SAM family heme chaperone HemW [Verrucomicrobiota bacterium]